MARFANELLTVAPEHTLANRVDLWRDHYDIKTMEPSSELLRSVEMKAHEH